MLCPQACEKRNLPAPLSATDKALRRRLKDYKENNSYDDSTRSVVECLNPLMEQSASRYTSTLRDVAGNLPSLARPLSRVSLEGKHEEARRALEEPRRSQRLQSAQHGALTLNGLSAG